MSPTEPLQEKKTPAAKASAAPDLLDLVETWLCCSSGHLCVFMGFYRFYGLL